MKDRSCDRRRGRAKSLSLLDLWRQTKAQKDRSVQIRNEIRIEGLGKTTLVEEALQGPNRGSEMVVVPGSISSDLLSSSLGAVCD